jgi:hypothetical protein
MPEEVEAPAKGGYFGVLVLNAGVVKILEVGQDNTTP